MNMVYWMKTQISVSNQLLVIHHLGVRADELITTGGLGTRERL